MRVLWITNSLPNDIALYMGLSSMGSGGWVNSALIQLVKNNEVELAVATIYPIPKMLDKTINKVRYFVIPGTIPICYKKKYEKYWGIIRDLYEPDIVHIHGSEFPIGLGYIRKNGNKGVVVSLQGLISQISKYKFKGLKSYQIISSLTLYDFFHLKYLPFTIYSFYLRSKYEIELIKKVNNVIGRTTWDYANCLALNRNVKYFHVEEILRLPFYNCRWSYEQCEKNTIFVSQVYTPIKGLHHLIKAVSVLKRKYPTIKVYIAGKNIINEKFTSLRGYGKICKKMIKKYDLANNIEFTGILSAEQMCSYYQRANVYVCCSLIENSPNSLCEAQMVGTPVVSSYVGGTPDFIVHNDSGFLYRSEDHEMLAYYVDYIFEQKDKISIISKNERKVASVRHLRANYSDLLLNVYNNLK